MPDMKLFRCWDSSATITKNEQFRNVTVSKEGELGGQEAAAMMLGPYSVIATPCESHKNTIFLFDDFCVTYQVEPGID